MEDYWRRSASLDTTLRGSSGSRKQLIALNFVMLRKTLEDRLSRSPQDVAVIGSRWAVP
jgi:hypothetical protein